MNVFESIFKDLNEAIKTVFGNLKDMLSNVFVFLKEIDYKEKVKFKPVLEIKPTKTYYRNKRISNYYCRNNC